MSNNSKGPSKNNFTKAENISAALYKLWVRYKPHFASKYGVKNTRGIKEYYGFMTKSDQGKAQLIRNIVEARRGQYFCAVLYDNQTKKEIEKFSDK